MVYLLRFHQPVGSGRKFVKYYLGYCADQRLDQRLAEHRAGQGARLVAAAIQLSIDFELVRLWPNATRQDERRLKRQHNHRRFDPTVNPPRSKHHDDLSATQPLELAASA
jgi:predicted GIY-YIG superfamily endonuclease